VADVRIIGGGLPVLPGTASSFEVASVPEVLVSMSAVLRGAKKFPVMTSLGGMFKAGDVLVCTASSASVLLGNHPPTLFVALLLLIGYFGLLGLLP
jgi:hypothetical protein